MFKSLLLVLVCLVASYTVLMAQDMSLSAKYGFKMLDIPVGVGISGQGGAGTYSNHDASAFTENPSAGLFRNAKLISVAQNQWLVDTQQSSVFYSNSVSSRHFGIGLRTLDYGKIDARDDTDQITGTFHPLDLALVVNSAWRLHPDHYFGVNANLLYEKIDAASSIGMSFDAGYTYLPPIKDMKIYVVGRNLGFTSEMDKEKIDLPTRLDWGVSKDFALSTLRFSTEYKSIHETGRHYAGIVGLQATYNEMLSLRFGYKVNFDAENWSAGLGFNMHHISVDYAYTPFNLVSDIIDSTHRVGLTYRF